MKRSSMIALIALAVVVVIASVLSVAFFARRVQVLTGERIECTYGHVVKDDVRTIEVRPSEASEHGVKTSTIVCDDHRRAEQLYDEAQAALAKGDAKTAREKLDEVLLIDRGFKSASAQVSELDSGKTPKPATDTGRASAGGGTTSGSGGTNPDSGGTNPNPGGADPDSGGDSDAPPTDESLPTGPIASLAGWVPDTLDGYAAEQIVADSLSLSREYRADKGDDTLVIAADQIGGEAGVADALKTRVKLPYDQDSKQLKLGSRPAYAGTDGRSVAVVGVADGPVLVVFQLRTPGEDPAKSLNRLIAIAKALPQ